MDGKHRTEAGRFNSRARRQLNAGRGKLTRTKGHRGFCIQGLERAA